MININQIPNSVINPTSTTYVDVDAPYPYLTFITFFSNTTNVDLLDKYNQYVYEWNNVKSTDNSQTSFVQILKQRYIDLLNAINLNYTNIEEQKFLTNLDINNEQDVDLLIPFYVNKIESITRYFIDKRDNIKYSLLRNATSNSKQGISQQLKNFIIDQVQHNAEFIDLDDYTIDTITTNLDVAILEKYDTFSFNYDVDPNTTSDDYIVKNELYSKYFNNNVLDYDKIVFVDKNSYLIQAIKEYPVFIKVFGFKFSTVGDSTDITQLKSKDFKSYQVTNFNELNVNTYQQLSKKYAGADMYYVSAGKYDLLFDANANYTNILNKKFTTIPSVPAQNLVNERMVGGYHLPTRQGLAIFNTFNKDFKINTHHTYVQFPDPDVCGNIYGTSLTQISGYPVTYQTSIDGTYVDKLYNNITGYANSNYYQTFKGFSTDNTQDYSLTHNFENIYQQGIIQNYKVDIYGNEYALIKQKHVLSPDGASQIIANYQKDTPQIPDINSEVNRGMWLWCFDGGPIQSAPYVENAITSDYQEWPQMSPMSAYLYDILLEAGHANNIQTTGILKGFPQRPYIYPKLAGASATFTSNPNLLSACICYDGGDFDTNTYSTNTSYYDTLPYVNNSSVYYNTVTSTIISTQNTNNNIYTTRHTPGHVLCRYNNSTDILPISDILNFIFVDGKQIQDLNILNFDIIQDVMIITHETGIIFNKIYIGVNGKITKSKTPVKQLNIVPDKTLLSRYFYNESNDTVLLATITKDINRKIDKDVVDVLYPTIYRISLNDLHCDKIYDPEEDDKEMLRYTIDSVLLQHILSIDEPITFYNSLNDVFSIIYNIHDWLGYSHTINNTFVLQHNKVELMTSDIYLAENINFYPSNKQ